MRPKIVFLLLLLVLIALALVIPRSQFFHAKNLVVSPSPPKETVKTSLSEKLAFGTVVKPAAPPPTNTTAAATSQVSPSARTVEELQALAMNNDAASLKVILAELANPDPQIRAAARDAAVQFGDPSAAVPLRAAAAQAADLNEKTALLSAAEFLELPPLEIQSSTNPHPPALSAPTTSPP